MKSVVLCGSQRYKDAIDQFADDLEKLGVVAVFKPEWKDRAQSVADMQEQERLKIPEYKVRIPGLVHAHLQRIREADICYVYNPEGYVGVNTTLEIGFAHGLNKIIYVYESELNYEKGELCREILYNTVIKTPEQLYEKLK